MSDVLFVTGMHRSGTSAFAGSARILGANLGGRTSAASKHNAKGFFELRRVVLLNNALLHDMGRFWADCRAMPVGGHTNQTLWLENMSALLSRSSLGSNLLVIKDPRISLFPHLWAEAARRAGCKPSFAILLRDPFASSSSIMRRDGFDRDGSLALWLRHLLEAERGTRGMSRAFVSCSAFVNQPVDELKKLQSGLDFSWPIQPADRKPDLEAFIDRQLMDESSSITSSHLGEMARRVYEALLCFEDSASDIGRITTLDRITEEFASTSEDMHRRNLSVLKEKARLRQARALVSPKVMRLVAKVIGPTFPRATNRLCQSANKRDPSAWQS